MSIFEPAVLLHAAWWGGAATVVLPFATTAVLALLGRSWRDPSPSGELPTLAVLVAASHEGEVVAATLEALLASRYPADRMEITLALDEGAAAETRAVAERFASRGVRVSDAPTGQRGKNVSLDAAVRVTTAEVLVFLDATAVVEPGALAALVAPMTGESKVGCVGGSLRFRGEGIGSSGYRAYWSTEDLVCRGAARLGYVPSVPGGFHALLRELYVPVANHVIRDMIDPMNTVIAGRSVVMASKAIATEEPWHGTRAVWKARLRITLRAMAMAQLALGAFWRAKLLGPALQLMAHKVARWWMWLPALVLVFVPLLTQSPFQLAVSGAVVMVLLCGGIGLLAAAVGRTLPVLTPLGFMVANVAAMAIGTLQWSVGAQQAQWTNPLPGRAA